MVMVFMLLTSYVGIFENRLRAVFCCSPLIKKSDAHYYLMGPPGEVACHGAATSQILAIYENFQAFAVSVLLLSNSLF